MKQNLQRRQSWIDFCSGVFEERWYAGVGIVGAASRRMREYLGMKWFVEKCE